MKQAIRWSRAVTTALLLAAPAMAMAADAQHIDIGKKGEVDFTRPMHLGSTLFFGK